MTKRFWLMKSEPDAYSIDDLERDGRTTWDGVRNYQARNHLRDAKRGDTVLFYHSSTKPPGVAGVARVTREAFPDPTATDAKSEYFDPKSSADDPRWFTVEVEFVERFEDLVTLDELKADPRFEGMLVTRRGQRLSVQPVEPEHARAVIALGRRKRAATR